VPAAAPDERGGLALALALRLARIRGAQVVAFAAIGAGAFPHQIGEKLIGFVEQSAKFLKGVYPGDTLYAEFTITEVIPQRTTGIVVFGVTIHNQNGECVLTGEHKYLLRK